jgi:hypothetical protein
MKQPGQENVFINLTIPTMQLSWVKRMYINVFSTICWPFLYLQYVFPTVDFVSFWIRTYVVATQLVMLCYIPTNPFTPTVTSSLLSLFTFTISLLDPNLPKLGRRGDTIEMDFQFFLQKSVQNRFLTLQKPFRLCFKEDGTSMAGGFLYLSFHQKWSKFGF